MRRRSPKHKAVKNLPLGAYLLLMLLMLAPWPAEAAIEEYAFEAESEEERFKKLTYEMRCPKCLNSNLAGSDAPIAADLRAEIYEQIREGRSNEEIVEFMSSRYGDFILYRPRFNASTWFLWFGPALALAAGLLVVRRILKGSQTPRRAGPLTQEEREQLEELLSFRKTP